MKKLMIKLMFCLVVAALGTSCMEQEEVNPILNEGQTQFEEFKQGNDMIVRKKPGRTTADG
ncbi:MAG: hypothetical protein CMB80_14290 [Flammeovirgaceae bacterium]|nr:hypothetical protein [Flammeovirgaceae bacterium]MBR09370.1 hypothetical protein [Rickettsiales bacterium]|tara:strand:- start:1605 stop:1787 length:183 start_codon:yes stop_codon:yes gene_type:complete